MTKSKILILIDEVIEEFDKSFDVSEHKHLRYLLHRIRDCYTAELELGDRLYANNRRR